MNKDMLVGKEILNVVIIIDNSDSLKKEDVDTMNVTIPTMKEGFDKYADKANIDVKYRIIAFNNGIEWKAGSLESGVSSDELVWNGITFCGETDIAAAIETVYECFSCENKLVKGSFLSAYRPVVILISDGHIKSSVDNYFSGVDKLKFLHLGKKGECLVTRVAMSVGDYNESVLTSFASIGDVYGEEVPFAFSIYDARYIADACVNWLDDICDYFDDDELLGIFDSESYELMRPLPVCDDDGMDLSCDDDGMDLSWVDETIEWIKP